MLKIGCFEISLGDTIGVGNPKTINQLLTELKKVDSDMNKYAIHCHDTYGLALANIYQSLENGIKVIDSSCAGLGGLKFNLKYLFLITINFIFKRLSICFRCIWKCSHGRCFIFIEFFRN
jgi:hypothetical protein